jgi:adenylate kinase family enzyme
MRTRRLRNHPRIVVVGTSGSGKTTFARQLAGLLDRAHIELDALHWGANWTVRADFPERVRLAIAADEWVVDGNYRTVRDEVWGRASAIVWLNYPFRVIFYRALLRTVRRLLSQELLYAGNRESFRGAFLERDGIPWWVIRTYRRRRREYRVLLSQPCFRHLELFELTSNEQTIALLQSEGRITRRLSRRGADALN